MGRGRRSLTAVPILLAGLLLPAAAAGQPQSDKPSSAAAPREPGTADDKADDDVDKSGRGALRVTSSPSKVPIFVDGMRRAAGETPVTLNLEPGFHSLVLRKAGFAEASRMIRIRAGTDQSVQLELARLGDQAEVRVTAGVEGAAVRVDGKAMGVTPLKGPIAVSAGRHTWRVSKRGRKPWVGTLMVPPGSSIELHAPLPEAGEEDRGVGGPASVTAPVLFVGGVATAVGSVLGALYLQSKAEYEDYPSDGGGSRREYEDIARTANARGAAASTALAIGVGTLATGLVLWLVEDGDGAPATPPDAPEPQTGASATAPKVGR